MQRLTGSLMVALFALSLPAIAAESKKTVKEAIHQCKVEYKEAKKAASNLKTHQQRVDAKRDAKTKYDECVERAKHRT